MFWSAASNRALVVRLRGMSDRLQLELADVRGKAQTARQIVLTIGAEIEAARGGNPTMAARLAAIESRLDALEP